MQEERVTLFFREEFMSRQTAEQQDIEKKHVVIEKRYFVNKADYAQQQSIALSNFSSRHGASLDLSELEQQLVHEIIDVSQYYPRWKNVCVQSPFKD